MRDKALGVGGVGRAAYIFEPPELICCSWSFAGTNAFACLIHEHFALEVYILEAPLNSLGALDITDLPPNRHHIDFKSAVLLQVGVFQDAGYALAAVRQSTQLTPEPQGSKIPLIDTEREPRKTASSSFASSISMKAVSSPSTPSRTQL
eukprot:CAMPEP_0179474720 /NCGR_PEP_ID=MMETSP0799-20121207/54092_1 /TAXON_ID=46947 /ORGANISM="Geminigera cryophila, Strain CCMP2564" /LENGTH=148 /DNA_ID=CAMNT_0021283897 /DNA_START=455 /DNA_END=899 /DNA_ORIENTATION=+